MGLLDDAIREHLDLKRRRGADPAEVERAEREALGPVRRGPEEPLAAAAEPHYDQAPEGWDAPTGSHDEQFVPDGVARAAGHDDELYEDEYEYEDEFEPEPLTDEHRRLIDAPPALADEPDLPPAAFHEPPPAAFDEPPPAADPRAPQPPGPAPQPLRFADEPSSATPPPPPAPARAPRDLPPRDAQPLQGFGETVEYDVERAMEADQGSAEDVLEETPEFLQDTPDHDRLWFEQKPPRDFDFDG